MACAGFEQADAPLGGGVRQAERGGGHVDARLDRRQALRARRSTLVYVTQVGRVLAEGDAGLAADLICRDHASAAHGSRSCRDRPCRSWQEYGAAPPGDHENASRCHMTIHSPVLAQPLEEAQRVDDAGVREWASLAMLYAIDFARSPG